MQLDSIPTNAPAAAETQMPNQEYPQPAVAAGAPCILEFNGMRYAPLGSPLMAGCNGFYEGSNKGRTTAGDLKLYKPNMALAALVINNPRQGQFVVNAHMTDEGPRYMFSTSSDVAEWLGIHEMKPSQKTRAVQEMQMVAPQALEAGDKVFVVPEQRLATVLDVYGDGLNGDFGDVRVDLCGNIQISELELYDQARHAAYDATFTPIKAEWKERYGITKDVPLRAEEVEADDGAAFLPYDAMTAEQQSDFDDRQGISPEDRRLLAQR